MTVEDAVLSLRGVFSASQEANRYTPPHSVVTESMMHKLRAKADFIAVSHLIEAVGAVEGHPVARLIHERFDGVFAVRPRDDQAWTLARATLTWMLSPEFDVEVERWRELAALPADYAAEVVG